MHLAGLLFAYLNHRTKTESKTKIKARTKTKVLVSIDKKRLNMSTFNDRSRIISS